jgi:hypothetical protein
MELTLDIISLPTNWVSAGFRTGRLIVFAFVLIIERIKILLMATYQKLYYFVGFFSTLSQSGREYNLVLLSLPKEFWYE